MTSGDRVVATISFRRTDRAPHDLTDGRIWPDGRGTSWTASEDVCSAPS